MDFNRLAKKILLSISLILVCLTACGPNIEELSENKDIDALIEILANDENYNISHRAEAAEALGDLGDRQAVRPLIDGLMDGSPEVRSAALKALWQINDPAYRVELDIIQELEGDHHLQFIFVNQLQNNDYNAFGALTGIITRNYDEEDKDWARNTLADFGLDSLLTAAASEDEIVSENAWRAISAMGSDIVPSLKDALSGDNEPFKLEVEDFLEEKFSKFIRDPETRRMCEGNPIPEAAIFNKGESGPHPIYICWGFGWNEELPLIWRPFSFEEVELLVFIDELDSLLIETCDYYDDLGGGYKKFSFSKLRYQRQFSVELREAKSGEIINSFTMMGSWPAVCKERDYAGDIYGDYPEFDMLKIWLMEQGLDF